MNEVLAAGMSEVDRGGVRYQARQGWGVGGVILVLTTWSLYFL